MPELLQNTLSSTATEASNDPKMYDNADDHLSRLLAPSVEEPWYRSLTNNLREALNPPKLPPLQVTSKPVAVKEIWGLYGKDKKSNLMSLAIHVSVAILLFTVASSKAVQQKAREVVGLVAPDIAPYIPQMAPKKPANALNGTLLNWLSAVKLPTAIRTLRVNSSLTVAAAKSAAFASGS